MWKSTVALILALFCFIPNVAANSRVELIKELYKSVVYVTNGGNPACSGIVIDTLNKRIQTAAHCNNSSVEADGYAARLLYNNVKADLAVFEAPDLPMGYKALTLAAKDPEVGEDTLAIGHGDGLSVPMVRRAMASLLNLEHKGGIYLMYDTPFVKGMSGGAVVNERGEVVGIISRSSQYVGLAVGANVIKKNTGNFWAYKQE